MKHAHYSPEHQRNFALEIVTKLRAAGFAAVWAGGCVRDMLLGETPKDYDVATNATPPEIRKLFGHRRTIAVGASFGVIVVVGRGEEGQVDVATFRSDGIYSDGRRPDSITFGTAEEDVKRRDFTINGLLYDPIEQRVLDYVGGQRDLEQRVIRAIGDAAQRLGEDKLRLLRAVRFAARLDFELEPATAGAVSAMAPLVVTVSPERIAQEMRSMLTHARRGAAVKLLHASRLAEHLIPALATLVAHPRQWEHALNRLDLLDRPSFSLALAAWLADLGPHVTAQVADRWRLSNKESELAVWLVQHQHGLAAAPRQKWSQVQPLLVAAGGPELVALATADAAAAGRQLPDLEWCRDKLTLPAEELSPPAWITGSELQALQIPPGKAYALLIRRAWQAQLDGELKDRDDAVEQVQAWWQEMN